MKKQVKLLMAAFLSLSILIPVTGCKKAGSVTNKTHDTNAYESVTYQTLNTNAYELVVPTGTRVESDEPDLPKDVVYWDPSRALKENYTIEDALKKYAFVAGHSTLIYTPCNDLRMTHEFYCADYGNRLFMDINSVSFLGSDGKRIDGEVSYVNLLNAECSSFDEFLKNLGQIYVGNMGYYSPDEPDAPQITIVEQTDDHLFATVKRMPPARSEEGLYYAKIIGAKVFYTRHQIQYRDDEYKDEDRQNFVRYSAILFDHLSPDDGVEPYIYDKIVNIPVFGGKHITSFGHIVSISGKTINMKTRKGSRIESFAIVPDPEDSYLKKGEYDTDWEDADGMQMRENTNYGGQDFVFTIDGTRFFCHLRGRNDERIDVGSLKDFLKLITKDCFIN